MHSSRVYRQLTEFAGLPDHLSVLAACVTKARTPTAAAAPRLPLAPRAPPPPSGRRAAHGASPFSPGAAPHAESPGGQRRRRAQVSANLATYGRCEEVVDASLTLLSDLASGYMSGKLLLKLEARTARKSHTARSARIASKYRPLGKPLLRLEACACVERGRAAREARPRRGAPRARARRRSR